MNTSDSNDAKIATGIVGGTQTNAAPIWKPAQENEVIEALKKWGQSQGELAAYQARIDAAKKELDQSSEFLEKKQKKFAQDMDAWVRDGNAACPSDGPLPGEIESAIQDHARRNAKHQTLVNGLRDSGVSESVNLLGRAYEDSVFSVTKRRFERRIATATTSFLDVLKSLCDDVLREKLCPDWQTKDIDEAWARKEVLDHRIDEAVRLRCVLRRS